MTAEELKTTMARLAQEHPEPASLGGVLGLVEAMGQKFRDLESKYALLTARVQDIESDGAQLKRIEFLRR